MDNLLKIDREQIARGFAATQEAMRGSFEGIEYTKPYGSTLDIRRFEGKIIAHSVKKGWWSHRGEFDSVEQLQEWLNTRVNHLNR